MAENIVESIIVKLGLDSKDYERSAKKVMGSSDEMNSSFDTLIDVLEDIRSNTATTADQLELMSVKQKKNSEETKKATGFFDKFGSAVGKAVGAFKKFFAIIAVGLGVTKLVSDVQKLNEELFHLEKNLGMSSKTIKNWQGAAGAMGGSAQGMTESIKTLNMGMNDFVMMGDTSLLPFFNALGVSMVDASGELRETDDVMLDLADSFSKMDREQAFSIASKMGIDEGTFNTLVQGRKEMEKMLEYQSKMYKSSEEELKASRALAQNRALLGQHWESLKTMMANAIIPLFVKLSEVALGIFEYLQENQQAVQAVFKSISFVVGMVLIPILIKATVAALAFMAPFLPFIAVVGALGAAFGLLYDDYKTWAEGGKSLFDWGAFAGYIDNAKFSTDNLKNSFAYLLTGYKDWASAAEGGKEWLKLKGFIEDNNVSVGSLTNGFKNLARELMSDVIPTLKGYGSILSKLFSGDFGGAMSEAKEMGLEYWKRATASGNAMGERLRGALDIATGHDVGTASNISVLNGSRKLSKDKANSIARVAKNIGVNPNDLAAVISFETGGSFNPGAKNPNSSATGLIQFMSGSGGTKGKYYGMSRDKFASLSFDEQMKYVEKYFKERDKRFRPGNEGNNSVADVYTAVTGYGYKRGSRAYELNSVWDSDDDGYIAKGEMVRNPSFRAHQKDYFNGQVAAAKSSIRQTDVLAAGAATTGRSSAASSNKTDVHIGEVKINTSSSTMTGTGQDLANGVQDQWSMFQNAVR